MEIDGKTFEYIFNHVVFPPKLPQGEEKDESILEDDLLYFVVSVLEKFVQNLPASDKSNWQIVRNMVVNWIEMEREGGTNEESLLEIVTDLRTSGAFALRIREQNCGWIACYDKERQQVIFDAFEASVECAPLLAAEGNLVRSFPGQSIAIPASKIGEPSFCSFLAKSLSRLSTENVAEMAPTTRKAGTDVGEPRDTTHPGLVTECLITQLLAYGEHNSNWPRFEKNIRDEANWNHSFLDWRRSPHWFVLRVALQTVLQRVFPHDGYRQYKNFILYLVCEIGTVAIKKDVSADHLSIIRTKIGRRIFKLKNSVFGFVADQALLSTEGLLNRLQSIHQKIMDSDSLHIPSFPTTAHDEDLRMSLENSQNFLRQTMQNNLTGVTPSSFNPSHAQRLETDQDGLPLLRAGSLLSILDFEKWVEERLGPWSSKVEPSESLVNRICNRLREYLQLAQQEFCSNPRELSSMMLIVLELWLAMDKMCVHLCPLLGEFFPEIPTPFLEPLLLPKQSQMDRAAGVEKYIRARYQNADRSSPRLFANPVSRSFAVRYYDHSVPHKDLRRNIEEFANQKKEKKRQEWNTKMSNYHALSAEYNSVEHEKQPSRSKKTMVHLSSCKKCRLETEMSNIQIEVDEWPLPKDEIALKTVVFELDCPRWFTAWRDTTWKIVHDLGRRETTEANPMEHNLLSYVGLEHVAVNNGQRLTLGSTTKSWKRSHYNLQKIPVSIDKILLPNALRFKLLDSHNTAWVTDQSPCPSIKDQCSFGIPSSPYSHLEYAVKTFNHTENQIIADQRSCDRKMSLHEFIAFGCLRAGERTQWHNIVRELALSNLSFNEEAVCILLQQASWEFGSFCEDTDLREAHRVFEESAFCDRLVETLEKKLTDVESNWNEHWTLYTLVELALRLLTLAGLSKKKETTDFLRKCRRIAMEWCESLIHGLPDQTGQESQSQQQVILKLGVTCQMTYLVEPHHIDDVLSNSDDLFNLVRSSIIVYENIPRSSDSLPAKMRVLLMNNNRVLHAIENAARLAIVNNPSGLNDALKRGAASLCFTEPWTVCEGNNERWVTNKTAEHQQVVHFNILSGELLVNNKPPGRLPTEYTKNPVFRRLFGTRILTVVPSGLPGAVFCSSTKFEDYEVHFAIQEEQLLITAINGHDHLRLIPHDRLRGDFPISLIDDCVHWMNIQNGMLEFRPLNRIWEQSSENWELAFNPNDPSLSIMRNGQKTLIDVRSKLFLKLSKVLTRIDYAEHIHVVRKGNGLIGAEMVRMRLEFFINEEGVLQSRQLSATVHHTQDIGCLYGLKNKLVLLESREPMRLAVLVPYGKTVAKKQGHHVSVSVQPVDEQNITYFRYRLDDHLHMLRGPEDTLATLYLAYLHATTGFVLSDQSIKRSGTEEALRILRQELLNTVFPLDRHCFYILRRLARLTPAREYYPKHHRKMQTVKWKSAFSQLVQHDDFQPLVKDIIDHNRTFLEFHGHQPTSDYNSAADRGDSHLLERARIRNAGCKHFQLAGILTRVAQASLYEPRDRETMSSRSTRVYEIAALVRDWPSSMQLERFADTVRGWSLVSTAGESLQSFTVSELLSLTIQSHWGSLYDECRSMDRARDSYKLMSYFCLAAFGSGGGSEMVSLRNLLAIAFSGQFRDVGLPRIVRNMQLELWRGDKPNRYDVRDAIAQHYVSFQAPNYHGLNLSATEVWKRDQLAEQEFIQAKQQNLDSLLDETMHQWPCQKPQIPNIYAAMNIDRSSASNSCALLFQRWYRNLEFYKFLSQTENRLKIQSYAHQPECPKSPPETEPFRCPSPSLPTLFDWIAGSEPTFSEEERWELQFERYRLPQSLTGGSQAQLSSLINDACSGSDPHRQDYGNKLQASVQALQKVQLLSAPKGFPVDRNALLNYRADLENLRNELWSAVFLALEGSSSNWERVAMSTVYPLIDQTTILSYLGSNNWSALPPHWKKILVYLGKTISSLRRCNRLIACEVRQDLHGFFKESETVSGEGWDAFEQPEWLLFEIENDLTIRRQQAEVAHKMINPEGGDNTVLQLNMGEGKTSVITLLVALALANGDQLLRLIVLKPLLRQSVTLLSQRLGGLQHRRIYYVPFSRSTAINQTTASQLQSIYQECVANRGILIALPEQILSFRLVGLDLMTTSPSLSQQLLSIESWIQRRSRSIIDESDEILDARFQLVYTVGNQQALDGHSDRWSIIQNVLDLVAKEAEVLNERDSASLDLEYDGERFPLIRFLKPGTVDTLIQKIVHTISGDGIPGVPFNQWSPGARRSAFNFINTVEISKEDELIIRNMFEGSVCLNRLLVLRGLLAHGILKFTLAGKRWMVDYGLHPTRCLMAVPYRSKGVPSESSEFGHPDVALTLTCLSYYYQGLTEEEVRHCFGLIEKENDPSAEYDSWIKMCKGRLDSGLQTISGVNLEDRHGFRTTLYPNLRYQIPLVDFYLSRVVFPKEAKEFPCKLSTSAWDIPSRPNLLPTTGFSGTNDNRSLLPLSITQRDLPHLLHTNAMVLSNLLREENTGCVLAEDHEGHQLRTDQLLSLINSYGSPIRVLIDVGAQILEGSNHAVAKEWLSFTTASDVEAAVFFDEHDDAMVVDRGGHVERLLASPFHQRMGACLIFLDQHHARGVDLKLPLQTRAAVTLGPRLTKDRLVQACSRMRELGNGQSVTFFIPPEVSHSIDKRSGVLVSDDVVNWTLKQTLDSLDSLRPLWASQGLQYHRRAKLLTTLETDYDQAGEIIKRIQEPEARTLRQMYAPWEEMPHLNLEQDLNRNSPHVRRLLEVWNAPNSQGIARLHEEQEREIAQEVQREEQVCLPPAVQPATHGIHPGVQHFAVTGRLPKKWARTFEKAFDGLRTTSAGQHCFLSSLGPNLWATSDFLVSVKGKDGIKDDEFLKAVNWVVSTVHDPERLVIISQYEANELLTKIRGGKNTTLHVYAPRTSKTMRSFRDLDFFTTGIKKHEAFPFSITRDLELFAGSLYFESFAEYKYFRSFLGLITDRRDDLPEGSISNEGFVKPEARNNWPTKSPFPISPLLFLAALLNMRGRGQGYLQTHLGSIIGGRVLVEDRF